ncbi:MAG: ABC transporter permease [Eubacterium sp.]|nr:ABC transporter permease [Eubacterium sp.]
MKKRLPSIISKIPAAAALIILVVLWEVLCLSGRVPEYMLPSPIDVAKAFAGDFNIMITHGAVTLTEAVSGLFLGIILAFLMATLMDHFLVINHAFFPLMVITQTIPTIAIAPLLILWMGFGMAPKITLVIITTFFPIAVGLLEGYSSVDSDVINLMKTMKANKRQIFFHVKLPAALPHFFSGLKISTSYAVVAAVVSEWLGGFEGLGVYMTRVKKAYAFDKMFAVIIFIVVISLALMFLVGVLRRIVMPWEKIERNK